MKVIDSERIEIDGKVFRLDRANDRRVIGCGTLTENNDYLRCENCTEWPACSMARAEYEKEYKEAMAPITELNQKTRIEVELREKTQEFGICAVALASAKREQYKAKCEYDDAISKQLASMTKADGAEDQRKAKAREACAIPAMRLGKAEMELIDAQAKYDIARAEMMMIRDIIALLGVGTE